MPSGWSNLSIPDELKGKIEEIADSEPGLKQYEVVEISVGIVYDDLDLEEEDTERKITVTPERKADIEEDSEGLNLTL